MADFSVEQLTSQVEKVMIWVNKKAAAKAAAEFEHRIW